VRKNKFLKAVGFVLLSGLSLFIIIFFEMKNIPVGSSIAGIVIGISLPELIHSIQDILDTTNWKVSQRKLKRGGYIKDDTIIRISFAYLYRIKIGNHYLLVKNERGTGKYQPVGGVYKLRDNEKMMLRSKFQVKDDNKIPIDRSSRNDYRLRMENRYLRRFVKRFDKVAERERIDDLGREFREELIDKGIVHWDHITYRYCGRHMTEVRYGEHFQIYELLLADVVELLPTRAQEEELERLLDKPSDKYYFATAEEITSLGVNTEAKQLKETIGDHTTKIIQENEGQLMKIVGVNEKYTVNFE
jgi:hypothetical protein